MDENRTASSVNLAKQCSLRIFKSDGAMMTDIGGSLISVPPEYDILQEFNLQGKHKASDIPCSTNCSTRISCRAHLNKVKVDMGDPGNCFSAEEESYSPTPFISFENVCSRKRPFTLLDTDIVDPNKSNPRGMSSIDKEIHTSGNSLSPSVTQSIGKSANFQGHHAVINRGKRPWLPDSPSKESSAAHGIFWDYFDDPLASSGSHNCTNRMKLDSVSLLCTEAKNNRSNEALVVEKHIEKQGDSSMKNVPFGFHRHSTLTVVSPSDEFLQVKACYWIGQIQVETLPEEHLRNLRKSEVNHAMDLQHEAPEKPLCLRGEACQSVYVNSQDGENLRSLAPLRIEKYYSTQNTETESFQGLHDDKRSTLSIQSANSGHYGALDASPTCNYTSNLVVKMRSCRDFRDKRIDEECKMFNSDRVDCCCSSSVRANGMETSCHQSRSSSKCLSSCKVKKDFCSNENSKQLKFAEKLELDHAMMNIDKEHCKPILSSTISYNKRDESESFERNCDLLPFPKQNSVSSAYMGLSATRTTSTGKEDLTSPATTAEASNMNILFDGTQNPSSRWIKRLKSHPMDSFALGTRSFKMDNPATNGRVDKLYMRVLNYSRSNSNVTVPFQKKLVQQKMEKLSSPSSIQVDSHVESLKKSHAWIRRLCHSSQNPGKTREDNARTLRQCGPESTKTIHENLERKLLPSIAAMALMGKAVNNFRPCEFRRRGPSVVWNTQGF